MMPSNWQGIKLVFWKECVTGMRFKAAWGAMLMFAFTALACVSLALQGAGLAAPLQAALLWVVLFFAAMAGLDRVFADEDTAGTLLALRIYGGSQQVLFGKMLYTFLLMAVLSLFIAPLFLALMDAGTADVPLLLAVLLAGDWGIAGAGTLVAALAAGASVQAGLFSILMFPVILPVFLPAIFLTAAALGAGEANLAYLGGMALYDMVLTLAASILFDYVWYVD